MTPGIAEALLLKILGSSAGTLLSLVFMLPRTIRDLFTRTIGSLVSGIVFAPQVIDYLNWDMPTAGETMVSAAALAAFTSWWMMGAITRIITVFKAPSEKAAPGEES